MIGWIILLIVALIFFGLAVVSVTISTGDSGMVINGSIAVKNISLPYI